ncbi:MAG: hypothetical protein CMH63_01690 [Nanoarchaeota archaeon]|jgi:hypothetical protein|nr:hypothetical protein [Nanoarchaeota archaeon]|tara:strand:+ start:17586 stop:18206 length:621 start_codon:yes stop_codon:yes gene_type:complete
MKKSNILKQLEKEKDPLKYLQSLLKKIKDKDLQKDIEKLIEKFSKKEGKKDVRVRGVGSSQSIEDLIQGPSPKPAPVQTEVLEDYQVRPSRRILPSEGIGTPGSDDKPKPEESYGTNVKGDYLTTSKEFKGSLETKGLVSRTGFTHNAETQEAIRKESGEKEYRNQEGNIEDYSVRDLHLDQDAVGRSSDLREMHKKKKDIEIYHG